MRFSIRDLLWATVVVAMGLAWWASYGAMDAERLAVVQHATRLQKSLAAAKELVAWKDSQVLDDWLGARTTANSSVPLVDWSVLDEPIVEP